MQVRLEGMPLALVRQIPRPAPPHQGGPPVDSTLPQRLAALSAAYHVAAGSPDTPALAYGWFRAAAQGPVQLIVGGRAFVPNPGGTDQQVALTYPPGAGGVRIEPDVLSTMVDSFAHWLPIEVTIAPVLTSDQGRLASTDALRPTLEDALLASWREPFAWLLTAVPAAPDEADIESLKLRAVRYAQTQARKVDRMVDEERFETVYRELRGGEVEGLWRVTLLAGGCTERAAAQVAGLFTAGTDLGDLPYHLLASSLPKSEDSLPDARNLVRTRCLAHLARPPVRELSGLHLVLQPEFDVTPELVEDTDQVSLGDALDRSLQVGGQMTISLDTLNRHAFVCGATGAGKSQTVRHLLEGLSGARIPWLVVEPAKAEYRRMGSRLGGEGGVIVIRPGELDAAPAGLNPLEPEPGFPLQTHIDLVRALFLAAFDAEEPFPQVLAASLTRCYEEVGWDLVLGRPRGAMTPPYFPTLSDLQRVARRVVTDIGYGKEVMENVRGFMEVRLSSLRLGTPGRFFEGGHPLLMEELLRHNAVLEIEDVGDDQDKAFLMGTILIRLVEHLRVKEREGRQRGSSALRHVTVFEEAHRLLRQVEGRGPAGHAVELFASLLAEIRAYGEGIVIAEQIPAKLIPDVIKNTALKVMHRLPAQDDRAAVGATMNLTPVQSEYVVTLPPGRAACFADGMDYPLLVRVPDGTGREANEPTVMPPDAVIDRFSPYCSERCRDRPCTAGEMREAEHMLERPDLGLWLELAVLAHVVGPATPAPGAEMLDWIQSAEERQLKCAVVHGVQRAVASRAAGMARFYSPLELARHVTSVVLAQCNGQPPACAEDEWRWQAGPFRWHSIRKALQTAVDAGQGGEPHPLTPQWERRYGRKLVGSDCERQLQTEFEWRRRERRWTERLVFGADRPSVIELAIGVTRSDPQWNDYLEPAVRALQFRTDWAVGLLSRPRAGTPA